MESQNVNGEKSLSEAAEGEGEVEVDAFTKLRNALRSGVGPDQAVAALTVEECQEVVFDWLRGSVVVLAGTARKPVNNKKERALARNLLDSVPVLQRIFQRVWPLGESLLERVQAEAEGKT